MTCHYIIIDNFCIDVTRDVYLKANRYCFIFFFFVVVLDNLFRCFDFEFGLVLTERNIFIMLSCSGYIFVVL